MKIEAPGRRGDACLSDARLDALTHGELTDAEVAGVNEHLSACAACRARCATLTEARDAWRARPLPSLASVAAMRSSPPSRAEEAKVIPFRRAFVWAGSGAAAMAAAATFLLMVRTGSPDDLDGGTRGKGDLALRVFLEGPEGARELMAGDMVHPDARLRFSLAGVNPDEYAVIVGVDGTGDANVYAPSSGRFSPIGRDGALEGVAQLDAAAGPERFVAVVCATAPPVDSALNMARHRTVPQLLDGCRSVERQFDKRIVR